MGCVPFDEVPQETVSASPNRLVSGSLGICCFEVDEIYELTKSVEPSYCFTVVKDKCVIVFFDGGLESHTLKGKWHISLLQ